MEKEQEKELASKSSPQSLQKMKMASKPSTEITQYTPEVALALPVDAGLGKEDYLEIQRGAKKRGANISFIHRNSCSKKNSAIPKTFRLLRAVLKSHYKIW